MAGTITTVRTVSLPLCPNWELRSSIGFFPLSLDRGLTVLPTKPGAQAATRNAMLSRIPPQDCDPNHRRGMSGVRRRSLQSAPHTLRQWGSIDKMRVLARNLCQFAKRTTL